MDCRIYNESFKPLSFIYYCKDCCKEFKILDNDELVICPECSSVDCKLISIESIHG